MELQEAMDFLEAHGNESTKKTLIKHGAKEPFFGVKVSDLKILVKKIKKDTPLALELYKTGNSDAMYLAGLITDEKTITKAQLQQWAKEAYWYYISEYTVPWVTAETPYAMELGLEWIESKSETIAACGWSTLNNYLSVTPDDAIDFALFSELLERAKKEVHQAQNRVRYTMNGFIIGAAAFTKPLYSQAVAAAEAIGKVSVEMGGTACKVPLATTYIANLADKGRLAKKRKQARC